MDANTNDCNNQFMLEKRAGLIIAIYFQVFALVFVANQGQRGKDSFSFSMLMV